MSTTFKQSMETKTFHTRDIPAALLAEKSKDNSGTELHIVFIPEHVTPLAIYRAELLKAGYSEAYTDEIIEGLSNSPLYENKAPQQ